MKDKKIATGSVLTNLNTELFPPSPEWWHYNETQEGSFKQSGCRIVTEHYNLYLWLKIFTLWNNCCLHSSGKFFTRFLKSVKDQTLPQHPTQSLTWECAKRPPQLDRYGGDSSTIHQLIRSQCRCPKIKNIPWPKPRKNYLFFLYNHSNMPGSSRNRGVLKYGPVPSPQQNARRTGDRPGIDIVYGYDSRLMYAAGHVC